MSTDAVASTTVPSHPLPSGRVLSHLTDDELTIAVRRFATEERTSTAQLVAHLAEFDARRLYLAAGFSSLFMYCVEVLRLSEHATYNRIEAARAARLFPTIVERLASGSLNLTSVRLLAPHLTRENHQRLLGEAAGRRRQAVEEIVARVSPRPDVATRIRPLPAAPAPGPTPDPTSSIDSLAGATHAPALESTPSVTLIALRSRQPVVVLAPGRYEIRFTASASTREKLRAAQDLLRHAVPDGDTAEVFDRALTLLIDSLLKAKSAATDRPRPAGVSERASRNVPAAVRRAVWVRDGARCAFIAANGRRCAARAFLEFHHIQPYAVGGPATVDNIALRCHAHNQHERELAFGPRPSLESRRSEQI
jgi:hypothetical protein